MSALRDMPLWHQLEVHAVEIGRRHLRESFALDQRRFARLSREIHGLLVDYSKHLITDRTLQLLTQLARERGVESLRDRMFA